MLPTRTHNRESSLILSSRPPLSPIHTLTFRYADAIKILNDTLLIDVAYYAVAGVNPGEGAIVTRGRYGPDDSHGVGNGTWVLNPPDTWYQYKDVMINVT